jgi:hypothetical protein
MSTITEVKSDKITEKDLVKVLPVCCYCNGCSTPAAEYLIKKQGPNEGKKFYTCPNSQSLKGGCKFSYVEGTNEEMAKKGCTAPSKCKNKKNPHIAVKRLITKDGPNSGKWFWSCGCDGANIFEILK